MKYLLRKKIAFIQAFGDLHGDPGWKNHINLNMDVIVFSGDFVDLRHLHLSYSAIIENLKEVLKLKEEYPEKIVLLWGNHDVSYLLSNTFNGLTEYQDYVSELRRLFKQKQELFQAAYQKGNWLFTHAGLTKSFWQTTLRGTGTNYASIINQRFSADPDLFDDLHLGHSGPLWASRYLFDNPDNWLPDLNQVVGHSLVDRITVNKYWGSQMIYINTGRFMYDHPAVCRVEIPNVP